MKKPIAFFMSLVFTLAFMAGSASAATALEETIDELLGTPYKWAGRTPNGFDCSGFTSYVFAKFGVELARSSKDQAKQGSPVKKSELQAGDLVFFNTSGKGISHVGIYVGDGKFAHSASNKGVIISKLSESYYAKRYVTARRVLTDEAYAAATKEVTEKATKEAKA